jgi:iron complex transport system substrate-binding protein
MRGVAPHRTGSYGRRPPPGSPRLPCRSVRIVSLVPHATELLFALDLEDHVVGVTHACDFPWQASELPKVTRDRLPDDQLAADIDRTVRDYAQAETSLHELDEDALRDLAPTLIVTQALCSVCAVSVDEVERLAQTMDPVPLVVALDPHTLGEALGDIRTIAGHTERKDEGVDLVEQLAARIDRVRLASRGMDRPKVLAIEWLDPLFVGGHWVPQLIEYAGGQDVIGLPGEPSEMFDWDVAAAASPDVVLVMPCGRDASEARDEALEHWDRIASLGAERVFAVDANAYFSRPGPRLVDGLELLSALLHPTTGIEAPDGSWYEVR